MQIDSPRGHRLRRRVMKDRSAVYHVMSRTSRKQFWLGDEEKERFLVMMRRQSAFTGVDILAYCVMSNHFHLLVRVPECPLKRDGSHLLTDREILSRYRAFYGEVRPRSTYSTEELKEALEGGGAVADCARRTVLARMGDLSAFMKELKQRFGIWFNHRHKNVGTIWSDRFKSVLVEDCAEVLTRVAAYIDLNPVRAGLVEDPQSYRWSGFGAAMRGSEPSRTGIVGLFPDSLSSERTLLGVYRKLIAGRCGMPPTRNGPDGVTTRSEPMADVAMVNAPNARLLEFCEAIVLGGEAFVAECRSRFAKSGGYRRCWTRWERLLPMFRSDNISAR